MREGVLYKHFSSGDEVTTFLSLLPHCEMESPLIACLPLKDTGRIKWMGFFFFHKEEWNNAICSKMDGPTEWLSSKNLQTAKAGESAERREPSYSWWECKLVQPLWRTVWRFLTKLKIELPYNPVIPLLGIYSREKRDLKGYMHPNVHCSTIYNSQL